MTGTLARSDVRQNVRTGYPERVAQASPLRFLDEPAAAGIRAEQPDATIATALAQQAAALGDPTRMAIAHALRTGGEVCICDLSWILQRPVQMISHHVGKMRAAGVVASRQDGRLVQCQLTDTGARFLEAVTPAA